MQLSIIIVSYNVKYFLEQCLHSVRRAAEGLSVEVIVVDNASDDGSLTHLMPLFPEVQFIGSKANLGFAKACNLGWKQAKGSHILFLNPDVLLAEDTLHTCLNFLKRNHDTGALGVRMIDGSGIFLKESKRGFPAPMAALFKMSGLTRLFPHSRLFSHYYLGHLSQHQNHGVDVLAGAFMLIPQAVLQQVGAFDEAFFMYGEDIDLSYRIQQAGYCNYYIADTTIIHFKGESTRRKSLRYVRVFYEAMSIFVRKHYHGAGAGLFHLVLQAAIGARAVFAALGKLAAGKGFLSVRPPRRTIAGRQLHLLASDTVFTSLQKPLRQLGISCTQLRSIDELAALPPGREVVLCAGDLYSFRDLIRFVQQHPSRQQYRFHMAGSRSLVGSDTSDSSGQTITLWPDQYQPSSNS